MLTKFLTLVRNPLESTVIMREIMKTFITRIIRVFAIPIYIISALIHYLPYLYCSLLTVSLFINASSIATWLQSHIRKYYTTSYKQTSAQH